MDRDGVFSAWNGHTAITDRPERFTRVTSPDQLDEVGPFPDPVDVLPGVRHGPEDRPRPGTPTPGSVPAPPRPGLLLEKTLDETGN
jgi:hypothetical protein